MALCLDRYRHIITELDHQYDPNFESICHIDRKSRSNPIESDNATTKPLIYRQRFRALRNAEATHSSIQTIGSFLRSKESQPGLGTKLMPALFWRGCRAAGSFRSCSGVFDRISQKLFHQPVRGLRILIANRICDHFVLLDAVVFDHFGSTPGHLENR